MYSISIYQIREVITSVVAAKKHLKILTWVQMDVQVGQDYQASCGGYTTEECRAEFHTTDRSGTGAV